MELSPLPATVSTLDVEGQPVRLIETDDGKRLWLCGCAKFKERATRNSEGFCAHTAIAVLRCMQDESFEIE